MEEGGSDSGEERSGMIRPSLVQDIRAILDQYPDNGQILKELIQNADDAGASHMTILFDQNGPKEKTPFPHFQGPALYVYNDAPFTENDWRGIKMLRNSVKAKDPLKVGRFGLGFKSVFHLTDYPSVVSGDKLMLIDPSQPEDDVCKLYSLLKPKRTVKAMAQTIDPVLAVLGAVRIEHILQGTLFRFPLRQTASDLSPAALKKENVLSLLECGQSEMTLVLVFLKSLESVKIETFSITENTPKLIFNVCLCEPNSTRKTYKEKIEAAITSESSFSCSEDVECKVEFGETSEVYTLRCKVNNTFVGQDRASEQLSDLSHNPDLSNCPLVGVAYVDSDHLQRCPSLRGNVFCFLPLPLQDSSCTGFPMLINGFFALDQERHHLKWPTVDEEAKGWEKQTDVACLWNRCLLTEALPYAYSELLSELRADAIKGNNSDEEVGRYYQAFPGKDCATGMWRCLADSLYKNILRTGLFFTHCDGGKWVSLKEAIICSVNADSSPETRVCETLVQLKENVCLVPQHVFRALCHYANQERMSVTWMSPQLVRTILRKKSGYKCVEPQTKETLLLYILSDPPSDTSDLYGLELIPLASGEYAEFQACGSGCVYVATPSFRPSLFPHLGEKFLTNLQGDLAFKMELLCKSGGTQLRHVEQDDIPELVSKELLKKSEPHEYREWLISVWSVLGSHFRNDLSKFEGLDIIPIACGTAFKTRPLMCPSQLVLKQSRAGELSEAVQAVLKQLGVEVIHGVPGEILQHPHVMDRYIHDSSLESVVKAITYAQQMSGQFFSPLQITEKQRMEFVSFLAMPGKDFSPEEGRVLRTLGLFNCQYPDGSSKRVSLNDVSLPESKHRLPVPFCRPVLKFLSESERHLAGRLGVVEMEQEKMITEVLEQMHCGSETYQPEHVRSFILFLCEENLVTNLDTNVKEMMRTLKCIPVDQDGNELSSPLELVHPSALLSGLFDVTDKRFPRGRFGDPDILNQLMHLGMLKDEPPQEMILDRIHSVTKLSLTNPAAAVKRFDHLLKVLERMYLEGSFHLPEAQANSIRDTPFIPVLQRPPSWPASLAWKGDESQFGRPQDLVCRELHYIVGTNKLVSENTSSNVLKTLGVALTARPQDVVNHLKGLCQVKPEDLQQDILLEMFEKTYEFIETRCREDKNVAAFEHPAFDIHHVFIDNHLVDACRVV